MSNGIELKAIMDSRIQQLKTDAKPLAPDSSKLKIRQPKKLERETLEQNVDFESSWVALSRKSILYNELIQDPDYEDEDCLVDFTKKEITTSNIIPGNGNVELDPWVDIVDEFGRNRLVRSSTLNKTVVEEIKNSDQHYDPRMEIRNLGTSHYQFSREEGKRLEELQELKNTREETRQNQVKVVGQRLQKTRALQERKMRIAALKKSKKNVQECQSDG